MIIRSLFFVVFLFVLSLKVMAQGVSDRSVQRDNFYWLTYALSKPLNEQVKLTLSAQTRRYAFPDRQHQMKALLLVTKEYESGIVLGGGFTYFLQALPINRNEVDIVRPELRPHQEVSINHKVGNWSISNRFMLEERWIRKAAGDELVDGYNFLLRIRYRLMFQRKLDENGKWKAILSAEPMFNAGDSEITNVFDQNRLYIGAKHKLSDRLVIDLGYIYWYQQFPSITDFGSFHIINLGVSHTLK